MIFICFSQGSFPVSTTEHCFNKYVLLLCKLTMCMECITLVHVRSFKILHPRMSSVFQTHYQHGMWVKMPKTVH